MGYKKWGKSLPALVHNRVNYCCAFQLSSVACAMQVYLMSRSFPIYVLWSVKVITITLQRWCVSGRSREKIMKEKRALPVCVCISLASQCACSQLRRNALWPRRARKFLPFQCWQTQNLVQVCLYVKMYNGLQQNTDITTQHCHAVLLYI